jgi:hypothetical protein
MKNIRTTLLLLKGRTAEIRLHWLTILFEAKNINGDYVAFFMDDSVRAHNQGARHDTTHDPHSI